MQTKVLKADSKSINLACELILSNEIVCLPTETVYGLFANALDKSACEKVFIAKNRPMDNPFIVHIQSYEMMKHIAKEIPQDAIKLADEFWPGPLTIILKKKDIIPFEVSAGLDTVGIRMPSDPIALEVIRKTNKPLAGPSANTSGKPSPTKADFVYDDLNGKIPLIIDGGMCKVGVESTVISLVEKTPIIYRPGFVTKSQIEKVLNKKVSFASGVYEEVKEDFKALSPGLKHKHYAPKADVTIINGEFSKLVSLAKKEKAIILGFDEYIDKTDVLCISYGSEDDSISQAINLFTSLRKLDEINAEKVYAMMPKTQGVGLAVYNRLLRAANFKVMNI